MDTEISRLEKALLAGDDIGLARAALIASGVTTIVEMDSYMDRLDSLYREIAGDVGGDDSELDRAKGVFNRLWKGRPGRYASGGSFRLTEVIDAQAGGREGVGNCLGLTLLYNVLARRFDLEVQAVHMEQAFGRGPHVFSVLRVAGRDIDIENVFRNGFDYAGHRYGSEREAWGERQLIANVYHSVGVEVASLGEWERAIDEYGKAIRVYLGYARAHLNRGIALVEIGDTANAVVEFSR